MTRLLFLVFLASGYLFAAQPASRLALQLEDYAARKGMTNEEAERWLAPNLG